MKLKDVLSLIFQFGLFLCSLLTLVVTMIHTK